MQTFAKGLAHLLDKPWPTFTWLLVVAAGVTGAVLGGIAGTTDRLQQPFTGSHLAFVFAVWVAAQAFAKGTSDKAENLAAEAVFDLVSGLTAAIALAYLVARHVGELFVAAGPLTMADSSELGGSVVAILILAAVIKAIAKVGGDGAPTLGVPGSMSCHCACAHSRGAAGSSAAEGEAPGSCVGHGDPSDAEHPGAANRNERDGNLGDDPADPADPAEHPSGASS